MTEHISSELSAFLDGRPPDAATRQASAHLDKCALCQKELSELRSLKAGLAGMKKNAAPPALMRSLNHAFLDAPQPRRNLWSFLLPPFSWKPVSAFAAVAVTIAGLFAHHIRTRNDLIDLEPLVAAHMRYQAESLVPNADPAHCNLSAQLVNYNAQED